MGIKVDRRIVLAGFNFKEMSLEYFHEIVEEGGVDGKERI